MMLLTLLNRAVLRGWRFRFQQVDRPAVFLSIVRPECFLAWRRQIPPVTGALNHEMRTARPVVADDIVLVGVPRVNHETEIIPAQFSSTVGFGLGNSRGGAS